MRAIGTVLLGFAMAITCRADGIRVSNWPDGVVARELPASSATLTTTIAISTAAIQVVPANPKRRGLFLYNPSTSALYIAYDATAAYGTHLTFVIPAGSVWSMPLPIYQGVLSAVRATASDGKLLITEMQ